MAANVHSSALKPWIRRLFTMAETTIPNDPPHGNRNSVNYGFFLNTGHALRADTLHMYDAIDRLNGQCEPRELRNPRYIPRSVHPCICVHNDGSYMIYARSYKRVFSKCNRSPRDRFVRFFCLSKISARRLSGIIVRFSSWTDSNLRVDFFFSFFFFFFLVI